MARPSVKHDVDEQIKGAYEKFDRQELIDMLSSLTLTYVVHSTMPFNLPGGQGGTMSDMAGAEKDFTFVKLVDQLKKRLPGMQELANFQVEEGKVVLRAGNQKIIFGERITSEFVATSTPPPPPPQKGQSPTGAAKDAASKVAGGKKADDKPAMSETQQEALNDIVTRFKNLELD